MFWLDLARPTMSAFGLMLNGNWRVLHLWYPPICRRRRLPFGCQAFIARLWPTTCENCAWQVIITVDAQKVASSVRIVMYGLLLKFWIAQIHLSILSLKSFYTQYVIEYRLDTEAHGDAAILEFEQDVNVATLSRNTQLLETALKDAQSVGVQTKQALQTLSLVSWSLRFLNLDTFESRYLRFVWHCTTSIPTS